MEKQSIFEYGVEPPKIIYLAAFKAEHPRFDITYQDINGKRDVAGDMMEVDLTPYDIIIATPPCNWWSMANIGKYKGTPGKYAAETKHLLPSIISKCIEIDKPFIIENVRSKHEYKKHGLFNFDCMVSEYGRHTYWTNIPFNPSGVKQIKDFVGAMAHKKFTYPTADNKNSQGGQNVHNVIDYWLDIVTNNGGKQL